MLKDDHYKCISTLENAAAARVHIIVPAKRKQQIVSTAFNSSLKKNLLLQGYSMTRKWVIKHYKRKINLEKEGSKYQNFWLGFRPEISIIISSISVSST